MSAWTPAPGDPVYATVRGVPDVLGIACSFGLLYHSPDGGALASVRDVTDVRPARIAKDGEVLLDPDWADHLWEMFQERQNNGLASKPALREALRALAAEQAKAVQPKVEEPTGLDARVRDPEGWIWAPVKAEQGSWWWRLGTNYGAMWADIPQPVEVLPVGAES